MKDHIIARMQTFLEFVIWSDWIERGLETTQYILSHQ